MACVGGIVLIPFARDGLGEVDDGVLGDVEGTVGSVAGDGEVGLDGLQAREAQRGKKEGIAVHDVGWMDVTDCGCGGEEWDVRCGQSFWLAGAIMVL